MRLFICWLISVTDWIGGLAIYIMFGVVPVMWGAGVFFWGAMVAIIPAFITAIYAAINYELVLSWAVVRWMSPLNIVSNRVYYFIKTLVLSGAAWALLISYVSHKLFPNEDFEWTIPYVRNLIESVLRYFNAI